MAFRIIALVSCAALVGCGVLVDRRATDREAQAEAAFPPEGRFVTVDGRRVHAVVTGSGPDLVLIHGASGNARDFTFAFAGMMSDRYRVIVMDRPGMGYTDRVSEAFGGAFDGRAESPAQQAALLQAAAAELGAARPIVLGHSYGGAVAAAWALNHPDHIAGMVNLSGAVMPWPGGLGALYTVAGSGLGGGIIAPFVTAFAAPERAEAVIGSIFAPDPAPGGYVDFVGAALSVRRESFRANARQVNGLRPHVVAMSARYPSLTLPVEIVHGEADTIVPPDIHAVPMRALVPGATLTILDGIGHMPHHSAPDAVAAAIDRVATRAGLR